MLPFQLENLLQAVGPTASLIVAAWILLAELPELKDGSRDSHQVGAERRS